MNTRLFQYFLAVYECRSLGKASQRLGISQPALSKSLRHLEQSLAVPLFTRHTWGVAPTVYAHAFLPYVRAMGVQFAAAREELKALAEAQIGVVRVGSNLGGSASLLPRALLRLFRERPGMQVFVEEGLYHPLVMGVRDGSLDLAVTTRPAIRPALARDRRPGSAPMEPDAPAADDLEAAVLEPDSLAMAGPLELPASLAACRLAHDPFHVVTAAGHPLAGLAPDASVPRLLDFPWVLPPQQGVLRPHLVALFEQLGLPAPEAAVQGVSMLCVGELLRKGGFVTLLPESVLRYYPDLLPLPVPGLQLARDLIAVWNQDIVPTPAASYFLQLLRSEAGQGGAMDEAEDPAVPLSQGRSP